eukprot:gene7274-11592_t
MNKLPLVPKEIEPLLSSQQIKNLWNEICPEEKDEIKNEININKFLSTLKWKDLNSNEQKIVKVLEYHESPISTFLLTEFKHPQKDVLLTGDKNGTIVLWDLYAPSIDVLSSVFRNFHQHGLISIDQIGENTVLSTDEYSFKIWNYYEEKIIFEMNLDLENPISNVKLIQKKFIVVTFGNEFSIYEIQNEKIELKKKFDSPHDYLITFVEFFEHKNESIIVTGSQDSTLKFWKLNNLEFILKQIAIPNCISKSNDTLVVGLNDGNLIVLDFNGNLITTLSNHKQEITCVKMKENFIVCGSKDKKISIWKDFKLIKELHQHTAKITKIDLDEERLISSSFDNTLILWDFKSFEVIHVFSQCMGAVTNIKLNPNFIIGCSLDYTGFCVDYRVKQPYNPHKNEDDFTQHYDYESQAYLKPPSKTWYDIKHEKQEIKKIDILQQTEHKEKNACVLLNVLSQIECEHYIKETEIIGYENLLGYDPRYRSNKRIIISDSKLSSLLFERIKEFVPEIYEQEDSGKKWRLKELNERFRFCRYFENQHFSPHYDGHFEKNSKERSFFTFMIYLNEPKEGGATNFLESPKNSEKITEKVHPVAGLT